MKVDKEKARILTEKHGGPENSNSENGPDETVFVMANNFARCIVDEDDGCTYCQRPDGEWEQVFCPD